MKLKELPGWASAVEGARQVFDNVPAEAFEQAGETEAAPDRHFICGPNEAYVEACRTGLVRLRNGKPATVDPRG